MRVKRKVLWEGSSAGISGGDLGEKGKRVLGYGLRSEV